MELRPAPHSRSGEHDGMINPIMEGGFKCEVQQAGGNIRRH
jgi:hypothetical protein